MAESPQRPGILYERPLVLVQAKRLPAASRPERCTVPKVNGTDGAPADSPGRGVWGGAPGVGLEACPAHRAWPNPEAASSGESQASREDRPAFQASQASRA